jgi:hypothetical protein
MNARITRGSSLRYRRRRRFNQRNQDESFGDIYQEIGSLLGAIGALVAFFSVYTAAISSNGWVIGITLGWLTAWFVAAVTFAALRYLWPVAVLLIFQFVH